MFSRLELNVFLSMNRSQFIVLRSTYPRLLDQVTLDLPEVIVVEVAIINDSGIKMLGVLLDDLVVKSRDHGRMDIVAVQIVQIGHHFAEGFLRFLVKIGHDDPGGQQGVIRMFSGHRCSDLGRQVVQLDGGHAGIKTLNEREMKIGKLLVTRVYFYRFFIIHHASITMDG